MITNLFSIFDPACPSFVLSNWIALPMFTLLLPVYTWFYPNRPSFVQIALINSVFNEFRPLLSKYSYFILFSTTSLIFILSSNLFGLAPYVFASTSQIPLTISFSVSVWTAIILFTCLTKLPHLITHLIPQGTPFFLMPFMALVEIISIIIRPLTLGVRLIANIVAGHLLIVILNSADVPLGPITPFIFLANQMLALLEVAVAFIQAYVFSVLIVLYTAEANN